MQYFSKIKIIFLFILVIFGSFFVLQNRAIASTDDNIKGWAWNSLYGWISFNSTGCDADCIGLACTSDGTLGCPAIGTNYPNYGVKVDETTGDFSGNAWSSNLGWISFERSVTGNPPEAPYNTGAISDPIAKMNTSDDTVTGWAKILSMGNDGWIRFDHGLVGTDEVSIDVGGTGKFSGWAYNSGSVAPGIGWVSFNCSNYFVCDGGTNNGTICMDNSACTGGGTCKDSCEISEYGVEMTSVILPPSGPNVSGWGWNSGVGWISFNSNDCDNDGINYLGNPSGCPATAYTTYGTNIDLGTGEFSGYAWNENVGWISFNRCGTDKDCGTSDGDTGNPPNSPTDDPGSGSGMIAKLDTGTGVVTGWAKILSLGDNGWIRFDDDNETTLPNYGVFLSGNVFSGWAYNEGVGGTGIGWISFNCSNYAKICNGGSNAGAICTVAGDCSGGTCENLCDVSDYKVVLNGSLNAVPTISNMTAPNIAVCLANALRAKLDWKFNDTDGDILQSYQLWVKKASDNNTVFYSGVCNSATANCANCVGWTDGDTCSFTLNASHGLVYNTSYKWEVIVTDDKGGSSMVTPYNSPTDSPNVLFVDDGNPLTFTTFENEFPTSAITHLPLEINAGQDIQFMSGAKYFDGSSYVNCDANCTYFWEEISGLNANIATDDEIDTIINFNTAMDSTIQFTVTDTTTGYSCSGTKSSDVMQKLPKWIETKK